MLATQARLHSAFTILVAADSSNNMQASNHIHLLVNQDCNRGYQWNPIGLLQLPRQYFKLQLATEVSIMIRLLLLLSASDKFIFSWFHVFVQYFIFSFIFHGKP